eukprot:TRINITY_DN98_c0_g1_i1.p1 TRINITY_DN98_c0_g1~~TRINITY_DN98_c0_g1_i1.p1  ORF type:complete len:1312 (-),score=276.45 TRINITY_DN98_c0_g1_i1:728-4663(-)
MSEPSRQMGESGDNVLPDSLKIIGEKAAEPSPFSGPFTPSAPPTHRSTHSGPLPGGAGDQSWGRTSYPDSSGTGKESPSKSGKLSANRRHDLRHSYGGEMLDQLNPLYRVSLPPTPDHQMYAEGSESPAIGPIADQTSTQQEQDDSSRFSGSRIPPWRMPEQQNTIVANTIFTGGFRNDPRGHIMMSNEKSSDKGPKLDPQAGPRTSHCSQKGCDGPVIRDNNGNEAFPCSCQYKICRECYTDALKDAGACPGCKEKYHGRNRFVADDNGEEDARGARKDKGGQRPGSNPQYRKKNKDRNDPDSDDSLEDGRKGGRGSREEGAGDGSRGQPVGNSGSLAIVKKSERDMQMLLYGDSKAEYGYGSAVWPKENEDKDFRNDGSGEDEDLMEVPSFVEERSARPLCRKIPVSMALISPYRFMVVIRLIILVFFLRWRFLNPTPDAVWLWLASVICETWFGLSWILDQFPKMNPVNRHTDLGVLREKFEGLPPKKEGGGKAPSTVFEVPLNSYLPGCDIFVSTADPEKEPVLTTANTVLSILASDYPVDKVACYVSDDGGALLTFEALAETASFAHIWIPFCRKHNIEPRCPEYYFQQRGDPTKGKLRPDFVRDRRRVKREYDEFKVRINGLPDAIRRRSEDLNAREELRIRRAQLAIDPTADVKPQKATWMADASKWPGAWAVPHKDHAKNDHAGIIQVMLAPPNPDPRVQQDVTELIDVSEVDTRLPLLVYVSREKRPGYDHNKKAGAMNALIRTSAIMSNGAFILNLDCDHYINNSDALREAMCFMMARGGDKVCYVQFPQRFEGIDPSDRYANNNTVFFDINMRGLDGIQGPFYAGTGCVFRRTALYGMDPPSKHDEKPRKKCCYGLCCCLGRKKKGLATKARLRRARTVMNGDSTDDFASSNSKGGGEHDGLLENSEDADLRLLPKQFGPSQAFLATIVEAEEAGKPLGQGHRGLVDENGHLEDANFEKQPTKKQPLVAETVSDAMLVISSWYEDKTEWGKRIGWIYGSVTEDVVTGYRMHNRGWKSVYAHPARPAFKGTAPINLTDRLHQVLRWATGSVEIFFSRNNATFGSGDLKFLQRIAYLNVGIYPFTSIFLTVYCFLPAICLFTNKFITPTPISLTALAYIFTLALATYALAAMEVRWSGVTLEEWWRNEQFWVISGTSAHLAAVYQGLLKVMAGVDISFTLTSKSADDGDQFADLYLFKWTSLMIPPLTIMMVNLIACVMGIARTIYSPLPSWSDLLGKLFFSVWVLIHLYPFAKGLMGRRNKTPTIIFVWAGLLSIILSLIWINISPPSGSQNAIDNQFQFP